MKTAGAIALCAMIVAAIGGVAGFVWWNSDVTDVKLKEHVCDQVRLRYNYPIDCKFGPVTSNGAGGKLIGFEISYVRPNLVWFYDLEVIETSGKYHDTLQGAVNIRPGNLLTLQRPKFAETMVNPVVHTPTPDSWSRLETEPANAAFDAMQLDGGYGTGAITYLSALRRLEKWNTAVEFIPRYWKSVQTFPLLGWEDRLATELDLIDQAPLTPQDRKKFDRVLNELLSRKGWSQVKERFENKRAARKPG